MIFTDISYIRTVELLFVLTGGYMLLFETKLFQTSKMRREKKFTTALAWINISLGVLLFFGDWLINQFFS